MSVLRNYINDGDASTEHFTPKKTLTVPKQLKFRKRSRVGPSDDSVKKLVNQKPKSLTSKTLPGMSKVWPVKKIRIYLKGEKYPHGKGYTFVIEKDVLDMFSLCHRISERLGPPINIRYIFGLDGVRRTRLDELENGASYIASETPQFAVKSSRVEPISPEEDYAYYIYPLIDDPSWGSNGGFDSPYTYGYHSTLSESLVTPVRTRKFGEKRPIARAKFRNVESRNTSTLKRHSSDPILRENSYEVDDEVIETLPPKSYSSLDRKEVQTKSSSVSKNKAAPNATITLDWIYGYRGRDIKRNLWVVSTEELLYFVAAVIVLYDWHSDTQRHYTEHTEDIVCISLHPSGDLVASAQRPSKKNKDASLVRIWSVNTLRTLSIFGDNEINDGVTALAFSNHNIGTYLLIVDSSDDRFLTVWAWETRRMISRVATYQELVYGAVFHPTNVNHILIYGKSLLTLWKRRRDGTFNRSKLIQNSSQITITCLEFTVDEEIITGNAQGRVTIWSPTADGEYHVTADYDAHYGPISCLYLYEDETLITGGERDRRIVAWDFENNFDKIEEATLPQSVGGIRTLFPQRPYENYGDIFCGTCKNMILEGSIHSTFNQIVFGHSKQVWALAVNQNDGTVVTAGYDKQVIKWAGNHYQWKLQTQGECICVAIHPYSTVVATGTIDGQLVFINAQSGVHIVTLKVTGSPISTIEYNLVGDVLACGSQNGSIYLFRVSKDGFHYSRLGRISEFQNFSSIDWSESGNFLQIVTAKNAVSYWNLKELSKVKNTLDIIYENWLKQTHLLEHMVEGVWLTKDSSAQLSVDKNENKKLLVASTTNGYIRLYRYPIVSRKAGFQEYKLYSSNLASVQFSPEEDILYSVGGSDATLMRWKII